MIEAGAQQSGPADGSPPLTFDFGKENEIASSKTLSQQDCLLAMGFFFRWTYGASFGIPAGIAGGLLFGISMAIFAEIQKRKWNPMIILFRTKGLVLPHLK